MTAPALFDFAAPFAAKAKAQNIQIIFTHEKGLKSYLSKAIEHRVVAKKQFEHSGFKGLPNTGAVAYQADGGIDKIFWGINDTPSLSDGAQLCDFITATLGQDLIKKASFALEIMPEFKGYDLNLFCLGWGMAHYNAALYQTQRQPTLKPTLVLPEGVDKKKTQAAFEATSLLKNLINTPPNDLGTDELAKAAKDVAKKFDAKVKVIKDEALNKQNFPMIYTVGKASPRRPQLVDIKWRGTKAKAKAPKITIVGKGIIYDTGGLNLKSGAGMRDMKKDMGGSAHALGVAWMIMSLNLRVELRVLIPIAENSLSGNSYRPGDVINSRKGLKVEIGDTDAEGRLVVADALHYACEEKPDLLLDFCTLTGAARVALGYDVPAFFSNNEDFIDELRKISPAFNDPIWPLPLYQGYMAEMSSNIADLCNDGKGRAGAIHGALFLQNFVDPKVDWVHLDCFAWEQNGRPGRPHGGADTGMRTLFEFIQKRFG